MGRRSSVEHASLFFKPVQFHLQPAYLFVERVLPRFRGLSLPGPPVHEKLRKLLHRRLPPLSDLNRMHLELRTQLAQRLLAPNRLHRHARFEGRTVLFSRRRHLLLLCLNDSPNSNLLPGLNSWDHYRRTSKTLSMISGFRSTSRVGNPFCVISRFLTTASAFSIASMLGRRLMIDI